ncbi:hypothetical protein C8R45DRAFT_1216458 [Mycena sanguinolenta]|nr:hypothetical protein C8R45DRAFT_1216458 [Mycena sanguinolenta]
MSPFWKGDSRRGRHGATSFASFMATADEGGRSRFSTTSTSTPMDHRALNTEYRQGKACQERVAHHIVNVSSPRCRLSHRLIGSASPSLQHPRQVRQATRVHPAAADRNLLALFPIHPTFVDDARSDVFESSMRTLTLRHIFHHQPRRAPSAPLQPAAPRARVGARADDHAHARPPSSSPSNHPPCRTRYISCRTPSSIQIQMCRARSLRLGVLLLEDPVSCVFTSTPTRVPIARDSRRSTSAPCPARACSIHFASLGVSFVTAVLASLARAPSPITTRPPSYHRETSSEIITLLSLRLCHHHRPLHALPDALLIVGRGLDDDDDIARVLDGTKHRECSGHRSR